MPIYEYACKKCDHRFEQLVRTMAATSAPKCPECGSAKTERALSAFAAVSSGSNSSPSMPTGGCCPCGREGGCGRG